jgi:nucleotide-binding universal stress UspA family protein
MSKRAVDKAKEFAKAFNAEILLLYVIEDIPIPATLILGNERTWISQTKRSIAKKLEEGWMKMAQEKIISNLANENIKAAAKVLIGSDSSPAEQIVKFAKDNQIDMIIMGSRRLEHISSKIKAEVGGKRNSLPLLLLLSSELSCCCSSCCCFFISW